MTSDNGRISRCAVHLLIVIIIIVFLSPVGQLDECGWGGGGREGAIRRGLDVVGDPGHPASRC